MSMSLRKTQIRFRILFIFLMLVVPLLVSSCVYKYEEIVPAKRALYHNDISSVAVLPFLNLTGKDGEIEDAGEIFSSELARFREIKLVHPSAVAKYLYENQLAVTQENAMRLGRDVGSFFNVQSVIIGSVTEFDPYHPPALGINIVLVDVHSGKVIDSRNEVYDASLNYVRNEVKEYASSKRLTDTLFKEDLILHKCDQYIRFVCHQIIKKYL